MECTGQRKNTEDKIKSVLGGSLLECSRKAEMRDAWRRIVKRATILQPRPLCQERNAREEEKEEKITVNEQHEV